MDGQVGLSTNFTTMIPIVGIGWATYRIITGRTQPETNAERRLRELRTRPSADELYKRITGKDYTELSPEPPRYKGKRKTVSSIVAKAPRRFDLP